MATAAPVAPVSECAATAMAPRMVSVDWVSEAIIFRSLTKIRAGVGLPDGVFGGFCAISQREPGLPRIREDLE